MLQFSEGNNEDAASVAISLPLKKYCAKNGNHEQI